MIDFIYIFKILFYVVLMGIGTLDSKVNYQQLADEDSEFEYNPLIEEYYLQKKPVRRGHGLFSEIKTFHMPKGCSFYVFIIFKPNEGLYQDYKQANVSLIRDIRIPEKRRLLRRIRHLKKSIYEQFKGPIFYNVPVDKKTGKEIDPEIMLESEEYKKWQRKNRRANVKRYLLMCELLNPLIDQYYRGLWHNNQYTYLLLGDLSDENLREGKSYNCRNFPKHYKLMVQNFNNHTCPGARIP